MNSGACSAFYIIGVIALIVLSIVGLTWVFDDKLKAGEVGPNDKISRQLKGFGLMAIGFLVFCALMGIAFSTTSICRPDLGNVASSLFGRP